MNRTDIPNFMGKFVELVDLNATSLNGQRGRVVGWDSDCETFIVQLFCDLSRFEAIKPMNLYYLPLAENEKEKQLYDLIFQDNLNDVNYGFELFKNVEECQATENHGTTYMKLDWYSWLLTKIIPKDHRYISQIKSELERVIEHTIFEDSRVYAKITLYTYIYQEQGYWRYHDIEDLIQHSDNHFGCLPDLFSIIYRTRGRQINQHYPVLEDLYIKSKKLILEKACGMEANFVLIAVDFLEFCDKSSVLNVDEEIESIRLIASSTKGNITQLSLAKIYLRQGNYKQALKCVEQVQQKAASEFGNTKFLMAELYTLKAHCYINMENKILETRALNKLKRFQGQTKETDIVIERLENQIKKMSENAFKYVTKEEKKNVRPRMKCSAYDCKNVEENVGEYKVCSGCEMQFYCSIECHQQHWYEGHKQECKTFQKQNKEQNKFKKKKKAKKKFKKKKKNY